MSFWWAMVLAGLLTTAIRLSFIAAEGRIAVPSWFRAMLPYVPVATLTALVVPELVMPGGNLQIGLGNPRLVAGLVAIAVAASTRSILATLAAGFLVLAVL